MNKRIRDLGMQAGLYVDLNGTLWPRAMSAEESELAYEKFAELIVQECGVALSPMLRDMISRGQAVELIKKHFGVEL